MSKLMVTVEAEKLETTVRFLRGLKTHWDFCCEVGQASENKTEAEEWVKTLCATTDYLSDVLEKADREESARCIADAQYDNGVDGA